MASLESVSEERVQSEVSHVPLLCGLPDDVALLCLARVPRRYHHILRCVSKRWRDLLCSEEWHSCRQRNNLQETWVYVVARDESNRNCCLVLDLDSARRCWQLLQVIRTPCSKCGICVEALGKKLYVIGGCRHNSVQINPGNDVHCYDASKNKWEKAASLPMARCNAVSASLNGKIYITGGLDPNMYSRNSWHIYDSSSNRWSSYMIPILNRLDTLKFIALDGKLYTIHRNSDGLLSAGVYDPSCRKWKLAKPEIVNCLRGPTVVADGTLYMFDEIGARRLVKWRKESEDWVPLGRLSPDITRPPCTVLAIGRSIYVIGRQLTTTVVIDVDEAAAEASGMLVCSSVVPNFECDYGPIISCKTITI